MHAITWLPGIAFLMSYWQLAYWQREVRRATVHACAPEDRPAATAMHMHVSRTPRYRAWYTRCHTADSGPGVVRRGAVPS